MARIKEEDFKDRKMTHPKFRDVHFRVNWIVEHDDGVQMKVTWIHNHGYAIGDEFLFIDKDKWGEFYEV